jgi:hypothetical protein
MSAPATSVSLPSYFSHRSVLLTARHIRHNMPRRRPRRLVHRILSFLQATCRADLRCAREYAVGHLSTSDSSLSRVIDLCELQARARLLPWQGKVRGRA